MGIIKKIFGWILIFFGCWFLLGTFINAPTASSELFIGYLAAGLVFSGLLFYLGWRWIH